MLTSTDEPSGVTCLNGGVRFDAGQDTNGNGTLDETEIETTAYTCNGTNGSNGTNGIDGDDCTVAEVACVATITCEDGSSVDWVLEGCSCDDCGVCDEDPSNDCVLTAQPIAPPAGTDTTPEGGDFDWSTVNGQLISNRFPRTNLSYPASYPKYGTARVLNYSDNEACVCFDVDCNTCSEANCSPTTCTYDLNANHTLTKYHIELRSLEDDQYAVTFEVNISADPPINYTDLAGVFDRLERTPVEYWPGYKIITEFGRGIQFLHGSYFNGAAAYGSMNYIDTQTVDFGVILHELGHTFEQYTRRGGDPYQPAQAEILNPIWRHAIRADDIRTSWYGNSNEWEDMAEFALFYALSSIEGSLGELQAASPERYRIWERILLNGSTIVP